MHAFGGVEGFRELFKMLKTFLNVSWHWATNGNTQHAGNLVLSVCKLPQHVRSLNTLVANHPQKMGWDMRGLHARASGDCRAFCLNEHSYE